MLTPLKIVIATEVLGVAGMVFGFLPREAALFLLGIFVYFALFAPLKDAVLFAVFSIPLYTALPITEGFDTMAGWRIIIAILFLRACYVYTRSPSLNVREGAGGVSYNSQVDKGRLSQKWLVTLLGIFFAISALSLFVAPEPSFGIRKLLFLANVFFFFFVVQQVIKNKQDWLDVFKYTFVGALLSLVIGYGQLFSVFFVSLHDFWMWWVHHVIPVFYGSGLEHLLSYSNTWFSYYENAEPTLRVFSVFPDSHSFALSMVLLLPMALTYYFARKQANRSVTNLEAIIALTLLAVIFSGTRGVWVGAIPVFITLGLIYLVQKEIFRKNFPLTTHLIVICYSFFNYLTPHPPLLTKERGNKEGSGGSAPTPLNALPFHKGEARGSVIKISIIIFTVFALLFPVASQIQKISQISQGGRVSDTTTLLRITTSFQTGELSNKGRIQIWRSTLESIAKHPFLGVGIGNYPVVLSENVSATKKGASAHSLYLDFIAEIGVFGGIVVLLIFFEILRRAIRVFTESKDLFFTAFSGFFAVFLLWVMAYNIVDVVLLNDKVLLTFIVLTALLYAVPIYARLHNNSR